VILIATGVTKIRIVLPNFIPVECRWLYWTSGWSSDAWKGSQNKFTSLCHQKWAELL